MGKEEAGIGAGAAEPMGHDATGSWGPGCWLKWPAVTVSLQVLPRISKHRWASATFPTLIRDQACAAGDRGVPFLAPQAPALQPVLSPQPSAPVPHIGRQHFWECPPEHRWLCAMMRWHLCNPAAYGTCSWWPQNLLSCRRKADAGPADAG